MGKKVNIFATVAIAGAVAAYNYFENNIFNAPPENAGSAYVGAMQDLASKVEASEIIVPAKIIVPDLSVDNGFTTVDASKALTVILTQANKTTPGLYANAEELQKAGIKKTGFDAYVQQDKALQAYADFALSASEKTLRLINQIKIEGKDEFPPGEGVAPEAFEKSLAATLKARKANMHDVNAITAFLSADRVDLEATAATYENIAVASDSSQVYKKLSENNYVFNSEISSQVYSNLAQLTLAEAAAGDVGGIVMNHAMSQKKEWVDPDQQGMDKLLAVSTIKAPAP